jgi:type VI secretion system secreted protein Hcp
MAFDVFLKIEGIDGESQDKDHKGEIEVDSFSWGVSNTASSSGGGGGGAGKAVPQDFSFAAPLSKASPNLMLACATGRHLPRATLTCRKAGFEFMKIRLDDVLVSSCETGGRAAEEDRPEDTFTLNFVKIDFLYTVQRTGETIEDTFDFSQV